MSFLLAADAKKIPLVDGIAQAVVTSPPYFRQRNYGDSPLEGGREETLEEYVLWLAEVLEECRRVLRGDGLAWVNLGDKANGSGGAGGDWTRGSGVRSEKARGATRFLDPSFEDRTFLDVPGAVLRELLNRGWRLRAEIVWSKGREAAESLRHVNRPRYSHEKILLLAPYPAARGRSRFFPSLLEETGTVWTFPPGGSGPSHLAPFPDELARRCILPSSLPGDLILDPFDGSGTTRRVAAELGRRAVGLDLYPIDLEETS